MLPTDLETGQKILITYSDTAGVEGKTGHVTAVRRKVITVKLESGRTVYLTDADDFEVVS
jgi:hypothetical protein